MAHSKNRWGIILFSFSAVTIGIVTYIVLKIPSQKYTALYKTVFPVLGVLFSVVCLFIGHFSYPRVHNLKVYLAGYVTGITSIAYFLLFRIPVYDDLGITILLLLVFINFIIFLFIPPFIKYRHTKIITFSITGFECVIIAVTRLFPQGIAWAHYLTRTDFCSVASLFGLLWLLNVIVISIFRLRGQFHLGGLFSGCALLYFLIWLSPVIFTAKYALEAEKVLFLFVTLYLEAGILVHWLSRMEHRISYDPLLQIYNRNYCSKIIEEQSNIKTVPPFGVAMVDIDHFKKVNDKYGHQAGDKVLYTIAQTIQREVIPDGIACRYGGEEIIIFFPNKRTKQLVPVMDNLREIIKNIKVPIKRKKIGVTISCGISHREDTTQTIMQVIHAADKALYRAKKGGRNQVKTGKTPSSSSRKK